MIYRSIVVLICLSIGSIANAGLAVNGRLADLQHMPSQTIEGKLEIATGDTDMTTYGGRFNLKFTEKLLLSGTVGAFEQNSQNGTFLGVGGQYVIADVHNSLHLATFATYNRFSQDNQNTNVVNVGTIFNNREPFGANKNIFIYGNLFLSYTSGNSSDTQLGIGGGLVSPTTYGEWFIGADFIDDPILGIGFRYYIN